MASKKKPETGAGAVVRVAIVGGGCAGMATAWQLQQLNRQRAPDAAAPRYDISVYEGSFRLGGKGASVRDAHGRIIEHGLHVWLGFYENAFRLMRDVYAAAAQQGLGPQAAADIDRLVFGSVDDAFSPEPHIGVASRRVSGDWQVWAGFLPPMKGQPGETLDEASNPFTWWGYTARALALVKALLLSTWAGAGHSPERSALDEAVELDFGGAGLESPGAWVDRLTRMVRVGVLGGAAGLLQGMTLLENWLRDSNPAPQLAPRVFRFIEALARQARLQLADLVTVDETLRRKTEVIDLVLTILVGLYRDRVVFSRQGLDKIDHVDYRDWLRSHGATHGALASPLVTGIYDLVFAYRDGRHDRPALSAAQAVRGALRMFFTYRGSLFWRMNAGMGDVVFAPLFSVLVRQGVRFHFRHELQHIAFDDEQRQVRTLQFATQGSPRSLAVHWRDGKPAGAWPLDAAGCWAHEAASPFAPAARAGRVTLNVGEDFDAVVFACGIDPFVAACGETARRAARPTSAFFKAHKAWDDMRHQVATVATRSAQLWLDQDLDQLGWDRGPVIVAGLAAQAPDTAARGFETWADMSHLVGTEHQHPQRAKEGDRVRSIAYFCGVMPDGTERAQRTEARAALRELLRQGLQPLWPAAFGQGHSAADHLVSADGQRTGAGQLDDQWLVLNRSGSERYTQALPGSGTVRISPLDGTLSNATIAGDWTDAGFNAGCVETAVMSGLLAAHAISGAPDLNTIVGYHHP